MSALETPRDDASLLDAARRAQAEAASLQSPAHDIQATLRDLHNVLLSTDAGALRKSVGFFGRLLGRGSQQLPTSQYQIAVRSEGQSSVVTVNDRAGAPAASADAQRIVKVLADELR